MTSFCATSRAGFESVSHRDPQRRVSRPLPSAAAVSLAIARATTPCLTYCEKQKRAFQAPKPTPPCRFCAQQKRVSRHMRALRRSSGSVLAAARLLK